MKILKRCFMILDIYIYMCFVIAHILPNRSQGHIYISRAWADESRERQIPGSEKFSLEHCLGEPVKAPLLPRWSCCWSLAVVDVAPFLCWVFVWWIYGFCVEGVSERRQCIFLRWDYERTNAIDVISCMAECAVGVGSDTKKCLWFIRYSIAQGNATEMSFRKGTCAKREDCEGLFSPPCLETFWISGGVIGGRGENRVLSIKSRVIVAQNTPWNFHHI